MKLNAFHEMHNCRNPSKSTPNLPTFSGTEDAFNVSHRNEIFFRYGTVSDNRFYITHRHMFENDGGSW
jgi:hypothetical protein